MEGPQNFRAGKMPRHSGPVVKCEHVLLWGTRESGFEVCMYLGLWDICLEDEDKILHPKFKCADLFTLGEVLRTSKNGR